MRKSFTISIIYKIGKDDFLYGAPLFKNPGSITNQQQYITFVK